MGVVLAKALLVDIDPLRAEAGALRIDGGRIVARGAGVVGQARDEVVDCGGAVVLPGMVNGHTHLYSALAVGMPPPPKTPRNFHEVLKYVWWRLDQALDRESIEVSARVGALQALRCGTTTLIDHHASPNCMEGSLDLIEKGISSIGLRGVLCYETTDRHGSGGRDGGVEENRRFLQKCAGLKRNSFAGLVGAHASFTLEDESLTKLAKLADDFDTGVHIHVAEDPCDEEDATSRRGVNLIDRLERFRLMRGDSIFAHGTHLSREAVERVNAAGLTMAHNPRSNMNNSVGYAPVASFRCPVMLGTDGIGGDMFAEAQAAWMISRHQKVGLSPNDVVAMLANSARRASRALGVTLGKLEVGAAGDVVVTDYVPFTLLNDSNVAGHLIFGMSSNRVRNVMTAGEWRLRDGVVVGRDETGDAVHAADVAERLWERMGGIEC